MFLHSSSAVPASLEMPGDTGKLKKHLTLFIDQLLVKGGRLNSTGVFSNCQPSRDLMKREPVSLPTVNDIISEVTDDVIEEEN